MFRNEGNGQVWLWEPRTESAGILEAFGGRLVPRMGTVGRMMTLLSIWGVMLVSGSLACGLRSGFQRPGRWLWRDSHSQTCCRQAWVAQCTPPAKAKGVLPGFRKFSEPELLSLSVSFP